MSNVDAPKRGSDVKYTVNKAVVNGVELAYIQVGTGKHPVLLIPGALGSAMTDFGPQLQTMDRDKFTVIGFDPRGYGRSIPPTRDFPIDFFDRDARDAAGLMKKLGFTKYSVLGWSDGGNVACVLAAAYPDEVEKLVVWGAGAYVTEGELKEFEKETDISSWGEKSRQKMSDLYGEQYFRDAVNNWYAGYVKIFSEKGGEIFAKDLVHIEARTLIIHGIKDTMCPSFHAEFLHKNIKNSIADFWEDSGHDPHLHEPDKFNGVVEKFLVS